MGSVLARVKCDRNVYLDDWQDVVLLLKKLEAEALASARDFKGRESTVNMPTPDEFAAMMGDVGAALGKAVEGMVQAERRHRVEMPER